MAPHQCSAPYGSTMGKPTYVNPRNTGSGVAAAASSASWTAARKLRFFAYSWARNGGTWPAELSANTAMIEVFPVLGFPGQSAHLCDWRASRTDCP